MEHGRVANQAANLLPAKIRRASSLARRNFGTSSQLNTIRNRVQFILRSLCLILFCSTVSAAENLREAAGQRLLIGCAVATQDLNDPKLTTLVARQFSCLTPEYEFMPEKLVDDAGKFTFEAGDRVVAFAEANHLPVFGHMLVWQFVTRKWFFETPDGKPLPREKALANLKTYITGVVGHYKGRIKAWNVVNEALSDQDGEYLKDTPARRAIGDDYIQKAFEFAQAADPEVELYYNDYNIELPGKCQKALRLIGELRSHHARIDAIGVQGHWLIDYPSTDVIAKGLDAFGETGLKVMITELDVDVLPRTVSGADMQSVETGPNPYPAGLPADMQEKLARRYEAIFQTLLQCRSITNISFWGVQDGRSWLNGFPVKNRTNYPLLFDRQLQSKPAFKAVLQALEQRH